MSREGAQLAQKPYQVQIISVWELGPKAAPSPCLPSACRAPLSPRPAPHPPPGRPSPPTNHPPAGIAPLPGLPPLPPPPSPRLPRGRPGSPPRLPALCSLPGALCGSSARCPCAPGVLLLSPLRALCPLSSTPQPRWPFSSFGGSH